MQKQEFLHLHELCMELRLFLEEQDKIPPDACSHYDALNIEPMAINRPKDAHWEAIQTLLTDLTAGLEEYGTDTSDSNSNEQAAMNA